MMKRHISVSTVLLLGLMVLLKSARADIAVIVNINNQNSQLSRDQVVDIYMGRTNLFPDGHTAIPTDMPPDSAARVIFYQLLIGKSVAQVNAYWARLLFTGRATPPRALKSSDEVIRIVRENRDAIGYIDSDAIDSRVKVIMLLK